MEFCFGNDIVISQGVLLFIMIIINIYDRDIADRMKFLNYTFQMFSGHFKF